MVGRVSFGGSGGALFMTYLLGVGLPMIAVYALFFGVPAGIMFATQDPTTHQPAEWAPMVMVPMMLLGAIAMVVVGIYGANKMLGYYWDHMMIEGKRARYTGTAGELFKTLIVHYLLLACTGGLYFPWFVTSWNKWVYSKVDVSGERLEFQGDPMSLIGIWLVGTLLTSLTLGIYFPWYLNNIYEWRWGNTAISGRRFTFQKDPGGLFVMAIVNAILMGCTLGFYAPWAWCKQWDWEAKHIG
jgi:uncharacterized membrane protein YjgN (DUF898 family)